MTLCLWLRFNRIKSEFALQLRQIHVVRGKKILSLESRYSHMQSRLPIDQVRNFVSDNVYSAKSTGFQNCAFSGKLWPRHTVFCRLFRDQSTTCLQPWLHQAPSIGQLLRVTLPLGKLRSPEALTISSPWNLLTFSPAAKRSHKVSPNSYVPYSKELENLKLPSGWLL